MRSFSVVWLLSIFVFPQVLLPSFAAAASKRQRRKSARWEREQGKSKVQDPSGLKRHLAPGRWQPTVRDALDRLLEEKGRGSASYSSVEPPVAVFVWDDVSVTHSLGEAMFYRMVTRAEFKFDADFWDRIPGQYGRARLQAAFAGFRELPPASWKVDSYHMLYRKMFFSCYQKLCMEWGRKRCSSWLIQLLAGFSENELRDHARETLREEYRRPVGSEPVRAYPGDIAPVMISKGVRRIPEMLDLYTKLIARGFDVWVMTPTDQWTAEVFAQEYGVDRSRIVGTRAAIVDDILQPEVLTPIPVGMGMAEAVTMFIGRAPALAVGTEEDMALLDYGRGLRLLVADRERDIPALMRGRSAKRWIVQPRFSPHRAPQQRVRGEVLED